jgi:hypothetical protein
MMAMHTQYEGHECMLRDRQGAPNQKSADTQVLTYPFDFLCKASALKLQTYREFQLFVVFVKRKASCPLPSEPVAERKYKRA